MRKLAHVGMVIPMPATEHITATEAAAILGISRATLNRRVATGTITPSFDFPGRTGARLFDRATILTIAQSNTDRAVT